MNPMHPKMAPRSRPLTGALSWLALAAALVLGGCDSDTASTTPSGKSSFKSYKPGSSTSLSAEASKSGAATAGAQNDSASTKVEEGDVAKLVGSQLYVLNQWRGLQVIDLGDPAQPKLKARVASTGTPREMYIDGNEAVVLVSQVAKLDNVAGKPVATAGSHIKRISLGATPAETASLDLGGYIAQSKRIGDKLVLVVPQVSWNPWYWGCWGPYGCVADAKAGGTATSGGGTGSTATGAASSDSSIAYPGGWGSGSIDAPTTKIVVLDLSKAGALSKLGEIEVPGGVMTADIQIGEVLIASQSWKWDNTSGTYTLRLHQIAVDAAGVPKLGATASEDQPWTNTSSSMVVKALRTGAGKFLLARQNWQTGGGYQYGLQVRYVDAGKWATGGQMTKAVGNYGALLASDGKVALLAAGIAVGATATEDGATDEEGKDVGPSGTTLSVDLDVIDLANPATLAVASHVQWPGEGTDLWSAQLLNLTNNRWLLGTRAANWSDVTLRVIDTTVPTDAKVVGSQKIASDYGSQVQVLSDALLAVPVLSKNVSAGDYTMGVQLMSLGATGNLQLRGLFQSGYTYWYQLKNLLAGDKLVRIANPGLELVDVANLDQPKLLATLELAAEVMDLVPAGGRPVALVRSWKDGQVWLRVLKAGSTDELNPDGELKTNLQWGRLYPNGNMVYAVDYQAIRAYDVSSPAAPKARGTWTAPNVGGNGYNQFWWNSWEVPQQGSTLYLLGTSVTYTQASGADCYPSTDGGGTEPVQTDAGSAVDPAKPDAGSAGVPKQDDAGSSEPPEMDGGSYADAGGVDGGGDGKTDIGNCYLNPKYTTRVLAVDFSDPDAPKVGSQLDLEGVSWASQPQIAGTKLILTHYTSLQGSDGQWYGQYWLDRIDISKPTQPKLVDTINVPGWLVGLGADGNSAVTLDWQPLAGSKADEGKVQNVLCGLKLSGGKAYLQSTVTLPDQAGAMVRHGDAVYVATWPYWWLWQASTDGTTALPEAKLLVYNVADLAKLSQSAALDTGAGVAWLTVDSGALFAQLGGGLGMSVWDVTAPTQPTFKSFLPTQGGWSPRVAVISGQAYVPSGWYGVAAYKL
ncbi:MAG: beta-propeller domain-containing protein [Deltaproteobacteria bacterium]|nr:beta-propeller domain-containing protein [Deltaproteobacteria bacterium]